MPPRHKRYQSVLFVILLTVLVCVIYRLGYISSFFLVLFLFYFLLVLADLRMTSSGGEYNPIQACCSREKDRKENDREWRG